MASSSSRPRAEDLPEDEVADLQAAALGRYEEGIALIKSNDIDAAVELFCGLLESQIELFGEIGLECAPAYFKYGSCLFYKAQDEADFLGGPMQSAADQRDGVAASAAADESAEPQADAEPAVPPDVKGKGKAVASEEPEAPQTGASGAAADDDEEKDEEDNGGAEEEEEEEKTDMELAWENLETARHILESNAEVLTSEQKLMLGEVHERLADLSMEKEDYTTCVADFKQALAMFQAVLSPSDRRIASLHFKIALALQYMDEPEAGLTHCQDALKLMEGKLQELRNLVPESKVEATAAQNTEDIQGVLEDLREKETELKEVISQNATTKEMIKNALSQITGGLGGAPEPGATVVDLGVVGGNSGRSRVTPLPPASQPAQETPTPKPAEEKAGDTITDPPAAKKKRTLEDLMAARAARSKVLRKLYSLMQSAESQLGGGEGVEGLYGSITSRGTQEILDSLAAHSCLCQDSVLVDVGAGLGRPLLHAAVSHDVRLSFGIELDSVKCEKAAAFVSRVRSEIKRHFSDALPAGGAAPTVLCAPVERIATLEPATHLYSFWEGVCAPARAAVGDLFQRCSTAGAVTVVQRAFRGEPVATMRDDFAFGPLRLVDTKSVAMSGSGRRFSAYTFVKEGWEPPCRVTGWSHTLSLDHSTRILPEPLPAPATPGPPEEPRGKAKPRGGRQASLLELFKQTKATSAAPQGKPPANADALPSGAVVSVRSARLAARQRNCS